MADITSSTIKNSTTLKTTASTYNDGENATSSSSPTTGLNYQHSFIIIGLTNTDYVTIVAPLVSVILITTVALCICWRVKANRRQEDENVDKRDSNPLYGVYYHGGERLGEAWVVDSSDTYGQMEEEGQEGTMVRDNNYLYE